MFNSFLYVYQRVDQARLDFYQRLKSTHQKPETVGEFLIVEHHVFTVTHSAVPKTFRSLLWKKICCTGLFLWLGGSMMIWETHGNHWTSSFFPCFFSISGFFNVGFQWCPMVSVSTSITHPGPENHRATWPPTRASNQNDSQYTAWHEKKCAVRILLRLYNLYIYLHLYIYIYLNICSMIIFIYIYICIYFFILIYSFFYLIIYSY